MSSDTIKKCFRKSGILDNEFNVVSDLLPATDPFAELDNDSTSGQADSDDSIETELVELMREVCENPPDLEMYLYIICPEVDDEIGMMIFQN